MITYLSCDTNNQADAVFQLFRKATMESCNTNNQVDTVFQLFRKAMMEFGIPSGVRSDRGRKNVLICHFLVSYRRLGRGSHIAGSSVHNQRMERHWRDFYQCVCCSFHEVFYFLEAQGVLDPDNECDQFVLHCVFLPVVDHLLQAYTGAWNGKQIKECVQNDQIDKVYIATLIIAI